MHILYMNMRISVVPVYVNRLHRANRKEAKYTSLRDFVLLPWYPADRKEAEYQMDGSFLIRIIYEDSISYNIIAAAVKVLGE